MDNLLIFFIYESGNSYIYFLIFNIIMNRDIVVSKRRGVSELCLLLPISVYLMDYKQQLW